ncbi:SGNH/GDSL hydrolase family protein [Luteimicrobium sp. DT211]|uniref:SGNH/GDSL hydrolase family protein n=1 Tax=Luteimicrobium sp. DT211 TaxID=3393412 RepID=UPI003CE91601
MTRPDRRRVRTLALALAGLAVVGAAVVAVALNGRGGSGPSYVALGDSYTAGPLIPRQVASSGLCERSTQGWAEQVARAIDASSFTNASCPGASPANVTGAQVLGAETHAPQVDSVHPSTRLVTISLGANDQHVFTGLIEGCASVAATDPQGSPCRDHFVSGGDDTVADKLRQTRAQVVSAVQAVQAKAPDAAVVLVGYPRIVPAQGTCEALPFAAGDYAYVDRWEHGLNAALASAAAGTGTAYVDTYDGSAGHDACAGAAAWITGKDGTATSASYHPNLAGMTGVAKIVDTYLQDHGLAGR